MSLTHFRRTAEQWFPSSRLEDQVRRVAGALPAAVALIDRERHIVFHDGDWSEWVGDRPIDGRTLAEVFEVADYESFRQSVDEALSGQRVRIEAWVPWAVGGPRHFELIFLPQASDRKSTRLNSSHPSISYA